MRPRRRIGPDKVELARVKRRKTIEWVVV